MSLPGKDMNIDHPRQFKVLFREKQDHRHDGNRLPDRFHLGKTKVTDQECYQALYNRESVTQIHSADKITGFAIVFVGTNIAGLFHYRHVIPFGVVFKDMAFTTIRTFFLQDVQQPAAFMKFHRFHSIKVQQKPEQQLH